MNGHSLPPAGNCEVFRMKMKRRTGFVWRFWLSVFLGIITAGLVEVVARTPRYDMLIEMSGFFLRPANYVAKLVFPTGPHSGAAMQNWGYVYYSADIAFFTLSWLIVLTALWGSRSRLVRPN